VVSGKITPPHNARLAQAPSPLFLFCTILHAIATAPNGLQTLQHGPMSLRHLFEHRNLGACDSWVSKDAEAIPMLKKGMPP